MTNSRNKGASFEREVANLLTNDLGLKNNIRRILEQTREKHLPDLILGNWYLECKRYGSGAEPLEAWWKQVLEATRNKGIPALVYKFDRRPIKVRVPLGAINPSLHLDSPFTADLLWDDFIFLLKELYSQEIEDHEDQNDRDEGGEHIAATSAASGLPPSFLTFSSNVFSCAATCSRAPDSLRRDRSVSGSVS